MVWISLADEPACADSELSAGLCLLPALLALEPWRLSAILTCTTSHDKKLLELVETQAGTFM